MAEERAEETSSGGEQGMGALQAGEGGRGSSPVSGRVWAKTLWPGFPVPSLGLPHCGEEGTGSLVDKPLLCARLSQGGKLGG